MKSILSILILSLFFFSACKSDSKEQTELISECETKPIAIFSDTMQLVDKHFFKENIDHTLEMVFFQNKMMLELAQSGCKYPVQQFNFNFQQSPPPNADDEFWKAGAISALEFLSTVSEGTASFAFWSEEMKKQFDTIKIGQVHVLEPPFQVMIDKVESPRGYTIVLVLSQKPTEE